MSNPIKSTNLVKVYAINGEDFALQDKTISICNHWNESAKVVIKIEDKSYDVLASQLIKDINNSTNAH